MPKQPQKLKGLTRKGNAWYYRVYSNYRERWIPLGGNYKVACRKVKALQGGDPLPARLTVEQAAARWITVFCGVRRNPKGQLLAERRVAMYLVPFAGHRAIDAVTPDDCREYRLWLERHAISPQTVAHILSDARCFFRWAAEARLLARTPFPTRLLPRIQERDPDRLSVEEVTALLTIPDPYAGVVRLGLGTGLRWSEMVRAQGADVDRHGSLIVAQTKSGKVRRVPLPPALAAELAGRVGRLIPYRSSGAFNRAVRALSGIKRFHAHQLRHTFACVWLERGGSLSALRELLGHCSVTVTERYARTSDDMIRREVDRQHRTTREDSGNLAHTDLDPSRC